MNLLRWLAALAVVALAAVMLFVPRVPQPPEYHDFADRVPLIVTSLPFIVIGLAGLMAMRRRPFISPSEKRAAAVFFIGTVLTGAGSAIYHSNPNNTTIVYDRIGIVIAFMGFMATLVYERLDGAWWLLPLLVALGVASVWWWRRFDDLRPYGWVQFFPFIAIVVLLLADRPRYTGEVRALITMGVLYACAKGFEFSDRRIYDALRGSVSGHTLKHLAAACGAVVAVVWIARRRPTAARSRADSETPARS